jgi:hypothetical protein
LFDVKTDLEDLLDLCPGHDHHVTMLHGDFQNVLVARLAVFISQGQEVPSLELGAETHSGRRAQ